jgi:cytochrome c peroxidase
MMERAFARWRTWTGLVLSAALSGCAGGDGGADDPLSAVALLGEKIFHDQSLSASGQMACASCHDSQHAFTPPNSLAVQLGGEMLDLPGTRQAPAIRYLVFAPAFGFDDEGAPSGGLFWDGRARSLAEQAAAPFLNPVEMANGTKAAVVAKLSQAAYADEFRGLFGTRVFEDVEGAYLRMTLAIQQYQREDPDFRPFSSKYDAFLRGKTPLTEQERRGLALFNAPEKGNCAACHPSARGSDGSFPLFTDFSYDALGVPRNPEIAANADPSYFDLGLCAREAGDLSSRADLCGAFKVPSLRNVAQRKVFFHNGRFSSLKDALTFYVQRDTHPEKWYPVDANGDVRKFDDLPSRYHGNVNTAEAPYDRRPGDAPALSDGEIDDVIAFLRTLDDGFEPREGSRASPVNTRSP